MPLLQLPAEILLQILDCVGSSFFREETARLTVCKQWFQHARLIYFKDLDLPQKTLERMMRSWNAIDLCLAKDTMESLSLWLMGCEDRISHLHADSTATFESDLKKLAILVQECPKLRTVRIHAASEIYPINMPLPRHNYLTRPGIKPFLSIKNLTVLDLDLCGSSLLSHQGGAISFHICPDIGALLTVLRRLRLRMRRICADVLRPPDHGSSLPLEEVIINLDLSEGPEITTVPPHSSTCISPATTFLEMKTDLEAQAKILAAKMASPKLFRILSHSVPRFELLSLDILTGKTMLLTEDIHEHKPWDADGATITDESDAESESEISSLSTFSDE